STTNPPANVNVADPRRGNTPVGVVTTVLGGDPDLQPEESESYSAGLIFLPHFLAGLRLSADYTRIEKTNEIGQLPGGVLGLLQREAEFPDRVVRGSLTTADQQLGYTGGPISVLKQTVLNLSRTNVEAWDFQVDYTIETEHFGTFRPYLVGTMQT